jgi:hypothetical protein
MGLNRYWCVTVVLFAITDKAVADDLLRVFLTDHSIVSYRPRDSTKAYVYCTSLDDYRVSHRIEVANKDHIPGYTANARRAAFQRASRTLGPAAIGASGDQLWIDAFEVFPLPFKIAARERIAKVSLVAVNAGKLEWLDFAGKPAKHFPFFGISWESRGDPIDRWELGDDDVVRAWLGLFPRSDSVALRFELTQVVANDDKSATTRMVLGRIEPSDDKDPLKPCILMRVGRVDAPFAEGFEAVDAGKAYLFVTHSGKAYLVRHGDRSDDFEGKIEQVQLAGAAMAVVTVVGKRQRSFVIVRKDDESAICNEIDKDGKLVPIKDPTVPLLGDDADDLLSFVRAVKAATKEADR